MILSGLYSIFRYGYKYSIDFTGGSEVSYSVKDTSKINNEKIGTALKNIDAKVISIESRGKNLDIRATGINEQTEKKLKTDLEKKLGTTLTLLRFNEVGPTIASDMIRKTVIAVLLGALVILSYIFYAFKRITFAIAAVLAMAHDVLVVLGTYSIMSHFFGAQLDTLFVTGILTTMSFSVHDTIIIFDKIREAKKHTTTTPLAELGDMAVSSTMIRSINNSLTIFFMLVALVVLGGESIKFFGLTLLIGTITGAYSSPFVATPIMIGIENLMAKYKR